MTIKLATDKQIFLMKKLQIPIPEPCTMDTARILIDKKLNKGEGFDSPLSRSPVEAKSGIVATNTDRASADRDKLIVRQSCLKAAVEIGNTHVKADLKDQVDTVKLIAEELENWVFR